MQKTIVCLLVIVLLAGGCLKKEGGCPYSESNTVAPQNEQAMIESYLSANTISADKHPSGMYYTIVQPGADASPNLCSQVQVSYTGALTNGTVFDYSSSTVFTLGSLIEGWKKGLPLIKKGGQIKLYIPPTLGYGYSDVKDQNGTVIIPSGSVLVFDVTLSNLN
jgi:FKBP-type peptidyl-prolyl cis-trans isomerase FkpA